VDYCGDYLASAEAPRMITVASDDQEGLWGKLLDGSADFEKFRVFLSLGFVVDPLAVAVVSADPFALIVVTRDRTHNDKCRG